MSFRKSVALLAAAVAAAAMPLAAKGKAPPAPAGPPKLVVAIAVDQFSADLFAQYRNTYTGGLKRLLSGAVFPAGYQSHAATETCPGHSTILTGARPARTGIIANTWVDQGAARQNKKIYCAEDETKAAADPKSYIPSVTHLLVPTLGELMKQANPASRTIAVAGKDRAALMMGGHNPDEIYFWFDTRFRTIDGKPDTPELALANRDMARTVAAGIKGYPLPAWCGQTDRAITAGTAKVGAGRLALKAGDTASFRYTPALDRATLALAQRLVADRKLGKGTAPDLLAISLSANDYVGHSYGTNGAEMCIQVHELDVALGQFFAALDKSGVDYAVVLTADHGGFDIPERLDDQALPQSARIDPALYPKALGKLIADKLRLKTDGPLLYADGSFGDIWLNRGLSASQRASVLKELKSQVANHPQVAALFTADEIAATPLPAGPPDEWSLIERARASFYRPRSGDAVMLLAKDIVPIASPGGTYVATHGSPWDYDRRVPILFWRKGMRGFEQPAAVETVDIAPSLAAWLRIPTVEGAFDGRCLDVDGGPLNTCAR